jgi:prepilin-type processing-associated H-X9-DG protein
MVGIAFGGSPFVTITRSHYRIAAERSRNADRAGSLSPETRRILAAGDKTLMGGKSFANLWRRMACEDRTGQLELAENQRGGGVGFVPNEARTAWARPSGGLPLRPGPAGAATGRSYAFHPGIANVLFGDGSVRPLQANLDLFTLEHLITRAGDEVVSVDF